jgi:hypothetical protein
MDATSKQGSGKHLSVGDQLVLDLEILPIFLMPKNM